MEALTKSSRVNTTIQVIERMNTGRTVVDAFEEVGFPRSTNNDIINKHPEAIADYQEMIEANAMMQLG